MKDQKIARYARPVSFFAGLVFITHPVQTEAVTYIIQRAASLAACFTLASLALYAASRLSAGPRRGMIYYIGSLISAVMAMFTKEVAIVLPLLICLYEFSFFKTKERFGGRRALPFLLLLSIIPLTMLFTKTINVEHLQRIGESAPSLSAGRYLLTQFRVIVTYIRLLFVPLNQNFDYDYPLANTLLDLPVLASLFLLAGVFIVAVRLFRDHRLVSFGIFCFFLALLPESSVLPINDVIFEHRLYLPMAGFSLFLASGMYALFGKYNPRAMVAIFVLLIIFNSALTYARNSVWKDDLTLWNDTIRKSPHKARPYAGRGNAYGQKGDLDRAILDYNKAIENRPNYIEAYSNRGSAYAQKGDFGRALLDFSKAIEGKPDYAEAYSNRGSVYAQKGDLDRAILDYSKVLEINPYSAEAYNGRGSAYARKGDLDRAILDCTRAIEIKPDHAGAYYNRGLAYRSKGDLDHAILDYSKVIEINPYSAEAYNGRGTAYAQKGDFDQAILDCSKAIEINPDYVEAYSNRAVMYFEKKEYAKSWEDVRRAQALKYNVNPSFIEQLKKASGKEG
jgi:tetratricopeptide (TPR) repeat protein